MTTFDVTTCTRGEGRSGVIGASLGGAFKSFLPHRGGLNRSGIVRSAPAPSLELQRAYAAWCNAPPGRYDDELAPHFVACQVALPVISALTARSPYPLLGVLNQGIRLAIHHPIPTTAPLTVRGQLVDASDDGYRARIHSQLTVGTPDIPRAMDLEAYAAVVLKRRPGGATGPRDDVVYETIGRWQPGADEGRKFFYLTGDFNPIHTWPAFARRTRFRVYEMFQHRPQIETFWDPPEFDIIEKFVEYCDSFGFDVLHTLGSVWDFGMNTFCDRTVVNSAENWDVSIADEKAEDELLRTVTIRTPGGDLRFSGN